MDKHFYTATASTASAATRILVFRDGENVAEWSDGSSRVAVMDANAARMVSDAFSAIGRDIVVDYEHQTLGGRYASPNGRAPAAGWITGFNYVPGVGLYANVRWTDAARRSIRASEYKYFSPVFELTDDGRVESIRSIALTNNPALQSLTALAASRGSNMSTATSARARVIARARSEYAGFSKKTKSICQQDWHINQALRTAGMRPLASKAAGITAKSMPVEPTGFDQGVPSDWVRAIGAIVGVQVVGPESIELLTETIQAMADDNAALRHALAAN